MRDSLFSITAAGRGVIAVAGLAALAACGDSPTGPSRAAVTDVPSQAQYVPTPKTYGIVRIIDTNQQFVTEGVSVIWYGAIGVSKVVYDNSPADIDPTLGVIKTELDIKVATFYRVCLHQPTKNFTIDKSKDYCNEILTGPKLIDGYYLVMRKNPWVQFNMRDLGRINPAPGAEITLTGPAGYSFYKVYADGSADDWSWGVDGTIRIRLPYAGTYSWCETAAPSGYVFAKPTCGTFDAVWEGADIIKTMTHGPKIIIPKI